MPRRGDHHHRRRAGLRRPQARGDGRAREPDPGGVVLPPAATGGVRRGLRPGVVHPARPRARPRSRTRSSRPTDRRTDPAQLLRPGPVPEGVPIVRRLAPIAVTVAVACSVAVGDVADAASRHTHRRAGTVYSRPGPYAAGVTTLTIGDRKTEVWYPASRARGRRTAPRRLRDREVAAAGVAGPGGEQGRESPVHHRRRSRHPRVRTGDPSRSWCSPTAPVATATSPPSSRPISPSWGFVVTSPDFLERGLGASLGAAPATPRTDADVIDASIAAVRASGPSPGSAPGCGAPARPGGDRRPLGRRKERDRVRRATERPRVHPARRRGRRLPGPPRGDATAEQGRAVHGRRERHRGAARRHPLVLRRGPGAEASRRDRRRRPPQRDERHLRDRHGGRRRGEARAGCRAARAREPRPPRHGRVLRAEPPARSACGRSPAISSSPSCGTRSASRSARSASSPTIVRAFAPIKVLYTEHAADPLTASAPAPCPSAVAVTRKRTDRSELHGAYGACIRPASVTSTVS